VFRSLSSEHYFIVILFLVAHDGVIGASSQVSMNGTCCANICTALGRLSVSVKAGKPAAAAAILGI
jgi:hypothetical protein